VTDREETTMLDQAVETRTRGEEVYRAYLRYRNLVRGGQVTPGWICGGPSFWYAEGGPQDRVLWRVDPEANAKEPLLDVGRLRAALTEALGFEPAGLGVPFAALDCSEPGRVSFELEAVRWTLDLDSYALEQQPAPTTGVFVWLAGESERTAPRSFPKESFNTLGETWVPESRSPDGAWFAAMADNQIVLRSTIDGQTIRLTEDGTRDVFWDVETVRWQAWSPDSQRLAAFKVDTTGMARIPTIHWLKPLEQAHEVINVPAGGVIQRSDVHVLTVPDGRAVALDLGDLTDRYAVVFGWVPDGSELLIAVYDRVFTQVELFAADPRTGATRLVLKEVSDTWLTSIHWAVWSTDTGFWLLPDGSGFVWRSERDGWAHLYRYDLDGTLRGQLTSGDYRVLDVVSIDQDRGWVYFQAHGDPVRPYDNHLYRVPLGGGPREQLTEGNGRHSIAMAPGCECFVDVYSSVERAPRSVLRDAGGTPLQTLGEADVSRLEAVGWTPSREYVVKAADGETDLWVTLHFPYDFDPSQRYPLVENIYGGPQTMVRAMDFGVAGVQVAGFEEGANYARALAQLGCIVMTMDGRGTPGRSKAFHDVVFRSWGSFEIADHAGAVEQLAERETFIDRDRVAVMGASWGGHFAFRALTQAPELYRWGVSEVPGYYSREVVHIEPYLGLPADNPELYDAADCIPLAPFLQGKLLQTGGLNDTCTQKDFFRMSEELVRLGIQHDTMTYPNMGHGFFGASGRYNAELKTRWLARHLGLRYGDPT
jgi:dipeptidyl aminopeptidase/acylaminoacyl peptidase